MSKNINKTDDPKNDDIYNREPKYITFVERGFSGNYEIYDNINEALDNMCYNELFIAFKISENEIKKYQALRSLGKKL